METERDISKKEDGKTGTKEKVSLKKRVLRGSAWTFAGQGTLSVLRLANSVILTRLLFPEAFGIMVIVDIFIQAMNMFSDLGMGPSIIQSRKSEDDSFIRTAWTIQIFRGLFLWIGSMIIAWPVAYYYEIPQLMWLIPAVGLGSFFSGFQTTSSYLLGKKLKLKLPTLIRITSHIVGMIVAINWAFWYPSVWALVAGGVTASLARISLGHIFIPKPRMRFEFHTDAAKEIFHFGVWIFLSSILTFLGNSGHGVVMAKLMTVNDLAYFALATKISMLVVKLVSTLSRSILFPVYSELVNSNPSQLRDKTYRIRKTLMLITVPPLCAISILGQEIVTLLFDDRYLGAGWMLQLLSIGSIFMVILNPVGSILLAAGNSRCHMLLEQIKFVAMIICLCIGYYLGKQAGDVNKGLILGFVVSRIIYYPFLAMSIRRYKVWLPALDFVGVASALSVVGLGLWLKGYVYMMFIGTN